ncbi:MAG: GGDEF domain-containing protein, partial [Desulfobulbaceae bacterium]|nr:GGDEF domain-containing protein [Desulfobulbaceae bacterium]
KQYQIQEPLPRTRELRQVVEAMNRMTYKVRDMFAEQVAAAERLREHAYSDSVTGLGNRRYFDSQINAQLDQQEMTLKGIVVLLQIHDLQLLNQQKGFQAGDELLRRVAVLVRECTAEAASCGLARLTGGDFGIFLPDAAPWEAERFAADLAHRIGLLAAERLALSDNIGHVGAVSYDCPTTIGRLLAEADAALRAAQQEGPNRWQVRSITAESTEAPMGEQQWKSAIELALQERKVTLFAQSVVKSDKQDQVLHLELFSRLVQEDGNLFNAAVFLPFAERLQIVSTLDRIVIEEAIRLDLHRLGVATVAINVSPASLEDKSFRAWVQTTLEGLPADAVRIVFEFAEFSAVQNLDRIREFAAMVRQAGHGIGLDHYGQSFSNLGYLQSLRPDYVKIDRAYTGELREDESDSRFFISSLCSVAHSLDIAVIAEGVETEHQWNMLRELNLDAMQGYFIDRPKPVGAAEIKEG